MSTKDKYPHLWAFFDGAFSANSGGHAGERDFEGIEKERMEQAERELVEFNKYSTNAHPNHFQALGFSRWLGMMADSGWTVSGQTEQNLSVGANDDRHDLMAYQLLDERY